MTLEDATEALEAETCRVPFDLDLWHYRLRLLGMAVDRRTRFAEQITWTVHR